METKEYSISVGTHSQALANYSQATYDSLILCKLLKGSCQGKETKSSRLHHIYKPDPDSAVTGWFIHKDNVVINFSYKKSMSSDENSIKSQINDRI
jgi:hypothetical protein